MPIQNVGTLLENLVLVEVARDLLADAEELVLCSSFAMPPLSEWRHNAQNVGFGPAELDRVADGDFQPDDAGFTALLGRGLRAGRNLGPSSVLLTLLLARVEQKGTRVWLNDLATGGHYPETISALRRIRQVVALLTGLEDDQAHPPTITGDAYPGSTAGLRPFLDAAPPQAPRLGFLDPMRYVRGVREGNQTSSVDHRRWLELLRSGAGGPVVAVHFTGNSNQPLLRQEIQSMLADARAVECTGLRVFKRQHYAVVVATWGSASVESIEAGVQGAWEGWVASIAPPLGDLTIWSEEDLLD
ncbi:MAG: hypothetical protein AB7G23_20375 [Vicinamibacterales bacterium]